jgi:hypothetical protein
VRLNHQYDTLGLKKPSSIFFLYLFIFGCNQPDPLSFVNKYDSTNFSAFRNTGFTIRGTDERSNFILFVSHDLKNAFHKSPVIITVDPDTKKIKEFSYKLLKDSSNVNRERLEQLAIKFLSFKIYSMSVDTSNNVFIRLDESDRPRLARFSDRKHIKTAGAFKGNWQHLKGNWYEAKE